MREGTVVLVWFLIFTWTTFQWAKHNIPRQWRPQEFVIGEANEWGARGVWGHASPGNFEQRVVFLHFWRTIF